MTPTIYPDVVQYSPEWWELRRGLPTASNFDKILTPKTMKPSSSQDDLIDELIADTVSLSPNAFTERGRIGTPEMEAGRQTEPEARRFYSLDRNVDVQQVGFIKSACGRMGCSPDGLVGEDGGLELKCPLLKTQVRYLREGGLPPEYRCQVHGSLIITGRAWWDFMSYAPGLPAVLIRVEPDDFTKQLKAELERFLVKLEAAKARLLGKGVPS